MTKLSRFPPTPRAENATERMTRLAERQFGVVSRAQLGTCGVTNGGVTRWIEDGRLHRVHRGVYAVGHRALSSEGQLAAALLRAGPGAALSHITAGWWWGILAERGDVVDVSAPGRGASFPGVRVHHPRGLLRAWHRGLPVTPVPAALLDMSSQLSYRELRRALAEALYRDLTDLASVRLALGRGHRGSTALARAIASHEPRLARTRSVLEERFLELCEEAALPIPAVNVKIGPITVDALWAEQRVVVELDGAVTAPPSRSPVIASASCRCGPSDTPSSATAGGR